MKFLKYFSLFLLAVFLILFFAYAVEYDTGTYYPEDKTCQEPNGQVGVYVHWFVPMNNTRSIFCDNTNTPLYSSSLGECSCK